MTDRKFAHLHLHTHYSLLDGFNRIPQLVEQTKKLGMNAVAVTDHGNLYAAVEFYAACKKAGLNPVIGYEAYLAPGSRRDKKAARQGDAYTHLTLLAKNATGYKNLIKLSSIAFLEGFYYHPRIDREILEAHKDGLVCLSGCLAGEFNQYILQDKPKEAKRLAEWFAGQFGNDFFIEIQNNGIGLQDQCTPVAAEIADRVGVPLVATADAHYLCGEDAEAHDVLFCINTGKKRDPRRRQYPEERMPNPYYVRSPADMYRLFPDYAAAVARTQEIADRVDIEIDFTKRHFPVFTPPASQSPEDYLRELCLVGLRERYGENPPATAAARLEHELGTINSMGFASYFLIVWDFVRFARENGIPSTARGSGCGAIVSYVLYLSHVCPLEYDLLFERFLDPNRSEAPDIDIDFCQDRRGRVIQYVKEKYGAESVAQIGTFGTLAAKAALKDVGRVLDVPLERVNFLCKLVPMKGAIAGSLAEAMASADFKREYDTDPQVRQMVDIAIKLEGTNRNVGTHAAGVVIANGPITDYVPVQRPPKKGDDGSAASDTDTVTTQWEMGILEKVGMLKMDFLGLRNLTVLDNCVKLIKKTRGIDIDPMTFPLDDRATYDLLQRGDAKGVFQLESDGIRELLKRMKPDNIRDLIAVLALYRPGPLGGGMVDSYVNRKHGKETWDYPHEVMKDILDETYGVMVYQEQIMRILNRLGGIELAKAYACIKAISKKKYDIIDARKSDFVKGCAERGVGQEKAEEIFDLIVFFGGYGFNKCVAGETRIVDADTGALTTVGDLFARPRPFTIHARGSDDRLVPRPVTDVVWNGRKPVFRLRTELGFEIIATDNHPFWTPDGWVVLGVLSAGDEVGLAEPLMGVFSAAGTSGNVTESSWPKAMFIVAWGNAPGVRHQPNESPPGAMPQATMNMAFGHQDRTVSDVYWDRVVSVEPLGVQDTYDLTVDVDHNFVADGLIVHNSHTAAYAQIGYQTAYLKAHYTAEYMAALLSSEIDDGNKRDVMVDHIADARKLGIDVLPPDVTRGMADFDVVNNRIVFGLTAIKGLGRNAAEEIVRARTDGGKFKDIYDFCERIDRRAVQKAAVEKMVMAGAFDAYGRRASVFAAVPKAFQAADERASDKRRGQKSFFDLYDDDGMTADGDDPAPAHGLPDVPEWPETERLKFEKEALDFYISSHPLAQHDEQLQRFRTHDAAQIVKLPQGSTVLAGGMVTQFQVRTVQKNGKRWAMFYLEDFSGQCKCILWSDEYNRFKDVVTPDAVLLFEGAVEWREGGSAGDLIVRKVLTVDDARREMTKSLLLRVAYTEDEEAIRKLDAVSLLLKRNRGQTPVFLSVRDPNGKQVQLKLNAEFAVNPANLPTTELEMLLGPGTVLFTR